MESYRRGFGGFGLLIPGKVTVDIADVERLQESLIIAGYLTPEAAKAELNKYGVATQDAVKALQSASGLPPTGVFDAATGKALSAAQLKAKPNDPSGGYKGGTISSRSAGGGTIEENIAARNRKLLLWGGGIGGALLGLAYLFFRRPAPRPALAGINRRRKRRSSWIR